jgi:hypothetical protein
MEDDDIPRAIDGLRGTRLEYVPRFPPRRIRIGRRHGIGWPLYMLITSSVPFVVVLVGTLDFLVEIRRAALCI